MQIWAVNTCENLFYNSIGKKEKIDFLNTATEYKPCFLFPKTWDVSDAQKYFRRTSDVTKAVDITVIVEDKKFSLGLCNTIELQQYLLDTCFG